MKIQLEQMRKKRHLTQTELAIRAHVPQSAICDIENGRTPSPRIDTVYKLAQVLKCTVDDLIVDEPMPA